MAHRRRKGTGSIRFDRAARRWVGYVTVGGKRVYAHGPRGERTADARLLVEEKLRPFVNASPSGVATTLGKLVQRYLATRQLSPTTRETHRYALRHLLGDGADTRIPLEKRLAPDRITHRSIISLKPSDLQDYLMRLTVSQHTKRRLRGIINAALEEAERLELITRNPMSRVPRPTVAKTQKAIWTPEEVLRFIAYAQPHPLYALFLVSLTTSMGNAELFGLQWSDVDLDAGYLDVRHTYVTASRLRGVLKGPKNASRFRRIALPAVTITALRVHREHSSGNGFVFVDAVGQPFVGDLFRCNVWYPLLTQAKVPRITPYAMRHTAKALMEHLGISLERQSARMGHADLGTTVGVYGHLYGRADRDVAEQIGAFFAPSPE